MFMLPAYDPTAIAMLGFGILVCTPFDRTGSWLR